MTGWQNNQKTSSPANLCLSVTLEDAVRTMLQINVAELYLFSQ